jgi:hypothetical protein
VNRRGDEFAPINVRPQRGMRIRQWWQAMHESISAERSYGPEKVHQDDAAIIAALDAAPLLEWWGILRARLFGIRGPRIKARAYRHPPGTYEGRRPASRSATMRGLDELFSDYGNAPARSDTLRELDGLLFGNTPLTGPLGREGPPGLDVYGPGIYQQQGAREFNYQRMRYQHDIDAEQLL